MSKDKRWEPVRRGDIYCSPGCGCGCTYENFQRATENGLVEVYGDMSGYWATTSDPQFHHTAETPKKAVKEVLAQVRKVQAGLAWFVEILEQVR